MREESKMKNIKWIGFLVLFIIMMLLIIVSITKTPSKPESPKVINLTCNNQDEATLKDIVNKLNPADTVLLQGACKEKNSVVITQNNVTIDGGDESIKGDERNSVFTVIGKNVTIKNFSNISGGLNGITVWPEGSVNLENVKISNNKEIGLLLGRECSGKQLLARMIGKGKIDPHQQKETEINSQNNDDTVSWCDDVKRFSFNPIKEAHAEIIVTDASLCNVKLTGNEFAVILDASTGKVGSIIGNPTNPIGCEVTIRNNIYGGVGVFAGSTFNIENATLTVENNNWIGLAAVDASTIQAMNSTVTIGPHDGILSIPGKPGLPGHRLCNEAGSNVSTIEPLGIVSHVPCPF